MPTSDRKLQANRLNAQKSTGPRTPEGKAAVSLNPITHGLRSRQAAMLVGERDTLKSLYQEMIDDWNPLTHSEYQLCERMAVLQFKIARVEHTISNVCEQSALVLYTSGDLRTPSGKVRMADFAYARHEREMVDLMDKLQRQQNSLERQWNNAMKALIQLQEMHRKKIERFEQNAARIAEEAKPKVMAAGAGGFEFSFDQPDPKPAASVTRLGQTWIKT